MFGLFGFGGFKGDSNSGTLLGRDNVSGYKRDGTSSSRHIDEKTGMSQWNVKAKKDLLPHSSRQSQIKVFLD
nr:hypothetical protein CFP56_26424 [Quercus suber]